MRKGFPSYSFSFLALVWQRSSNERENEYEQRVLSFPLQTEPRTSVSGLFPLHTAEGCQPLYRVLTRAARIRIFGQDEQNGRDQSVAKSNVDLAPRA